jgi:hypothetical protein
MIPGAGWWVSFEDDKKITRQRKIICFVLEGSELIPYIVSGDGRAQRAHNTATLFYPVTDE